MTGLTLYFACPDMLAMVEINMVRKIVYAYPLYGFRHGGVPCVTIFRVKTCIPVQLIYFCGTVNFISLVIIQLGTFCILRNVFMAIHTNIHRRYGSRFTFPCIAMT